MKMTKAFTLIELVFVIVILGVLAAVALPKFTKTKELADVAKGRTDIATIRAAIVNERQSRLILGVNSYIDKLSTGGVGEKLFTGNGAGRNLLTYGITAGTASGTWAIVSDTRYTFNVDGTLTTFDYNSSTGIFTCAAGVNDCDALVD